MERKLHKRTPIHFSAKIWVIFSEYVNIWIWHFSVFLAEGRTSHGIGLTFLLPFGVTENPPPFC